MFFIVPDRTESNDEPSTSRNKPIADLPNKRKRVAEASEHPTTLQPRRIARACDRCRLKKARCSGGKVCTRCARDGVICVTTDDLKKDDKPPNPAYVHLVETQRDQLAQALYTLLRDPNIQTSSELKETLSKMGISTGDFRQPHLPPESSTDDTISIPVQAPQSWNDIFENLDTVQLEEIELSCVGDPSFQDVFAQETGQQVLLPSRSNYQADARLTDFEFWGQDRVRPGSGNSQYDQFSTLVSADNTSLDPRILSGRNGNQGQI